MSLIQVQCGQCAQRFKAKPQLAGKRVKCPTCSAPIQIPSSVAADSVAVRCSDCFQDFRAEKQDIGLQVPCPSCGVLVTVGGRRSPEPVPAATPVDSDPLGLGTLDSSLQGQVLRAPVQKSRFGDGANSSLDLKRFWPSGAVVGVGLVSLLMSVFSGHVMAGGILFLGGLAIAASGIIFPPSRAARARKPGNAGMQVAASIATGIFVVVFFVLRVLGRLNRRGRLNNAAEVGYFTGVLLGIGVVVGVVAGFIYLVVRFGFFRPAAVFYTVAALGLPLLYVSVAGLTPHADRPVAALTEDQPLPTFPDLGAVTEIASGVNFQEVRLPVPAGQPGYASKLYVYTPQGEQAPHSLPCVFIASAGAVPFTGMDLGSADQPEHIPYVQAGFVVVAYEIDGYLNDAENASNRQYINALEQYWSARAGLTNARNAIEFALAKIPSVDPANLFTAGHSSAGLQSLLLAANEPRLRGCIAYAPVSDLEATVSEMLPALRQAVPDLDSLLNLASPRANESRIQCPVFLFHARDDSVVPYSQTYGLAGRLRQAGHAVEFVQVPSGGHYDPMISTGIPRAINWLGQFTGAAAAQPAVAGSGPPVGSAGQAPPAQIEQQTEKLRQLLAERDKLSPDELQTRINEILGTTSSDIWEQLDQVRTAFAGDSAMQRAADELRDRMEAVLGPRSQPKASGRMPSSPFLPSTPPGNDNPAVGGGLAEVDPLAQRRALQELARRDPQRADAAERERVIHTLNQAAAGDDPFAQKEAIKALATWGDASSVDVLLSLLTDRTNRMVNSEVYRTLGRLKDPRSALPVAQKLGDFFDRNDARECLRAMGPIAEDALIAVAPANDPDVCVAALTLLGECGTDKCLMVLRKALQSRNPIVREAGKSALRSVRLRNPPGGSNTTDD